MLRIDTRISATAIYKVLGLGRPGKRIVFQANFRDYDATFPLHQPDGSVLVIGIMEPGPALVEGGAR